MGRGTALKYKIRYTEGKTEEYLVNGEWIKKDNVPEMREWRKKYESSLIPYLRKAKRKMTERNVEWEKSNRKIYGEFELDTYDKIKYLFDKQIERYGMKCPITLGDLTTVRNNNLGKENTLKLFTNLSPDRLLSYYNYSRQNTLFTSVGWNISRADWSLEEMKFLFKNEYFERYIEILMERFPDKKYDLEARGLI